MTDKEDYTYNGQEPPMPTANERQDIISAFESLHNPAPDADKVWAEIQKSTVDKHDDSNEHDDGEPSLLRRLLPSLLLIAAACVALLLMLWPTGKAELKNGEVISQIESGTTVTVTDAKGQAVALKRNSVSFAQTTSAASTSEAVVTTPRGHDCTVTLPDGTRVWLNAESELSFPRRFTGGTRMVKLKGEGYFEVVHDSSHPFVVHTEYLDTRVLGTTFCVSAYSGKSAHVVLIEGRVAVNAGASNQALTLNAGQEAAFSGGNMQVNSVDTYPYTQWKEGFFYFHDASLLQIMSQIGRWYNKTVVFENQKVMQMRLHFVAERSQSLQETINQLNQQDGVNVEMASGEIDIK